jgi:hypothetical protein
MRKQLKTKRRSCGLCKPHKRGLENRWKPRVRAALLAAAQDTASAVDTAGQRPARRPRAVLPRS